MRLPSRSVARSVKSWMPTPRLVYSNGELQGASADPSREHSKVVPRSFAENSKVAVVWMVVESGAESIVVSGGSPTGGSSSHHTCRAGLRSTLPEMSTARTSNVWLLCSSRPEYSTGEVHGPNAAPSSEHWKVTVLALSLPMNSKVATSFVLGCGGNSTRIVSGAIWSVCSPGPPSQRMLKHCSGFSVNGSMAPVLPCALLPPPSMFVRPFEPALAQMPQPPLSLAMLALMVWLTLGT